MPSSISTSRRWLSLYVLAFIGVAVLGWLYAARYEPETRFWTQVFENRRVELTELPDGPRVLFTGDSFCAFGIDPARFRASTGVPAMNLGGTRQMGLAVFMTEALDQARDGDTLVLACNPVLLAQDSDEALTKAGAQMAISLGQDFPLTEKLKGARPGFSHLVTLGAKVGMRAPLFRYQMEGYRAGGQVVTDLRDHPSSSTVPFVMTEEDRARALARLGFWQERCREKGVRLLYLMPIELTAQSVIEGNRRAKTEVLDFLRDNAEVVVIEAPLGACSPDESIFADTLFHLTEDGARWFTGEISADIKKALRR